MRGAMQSFAAYNWLTVTETAESLSVSRSHVLRLIQGGELEACDVSTPGAKRPTYHVNPASLTAFVKRRTVRAA